MVDDNKKNEIDKVSGVETTGHDWDGIKELNFPAPRWWLVVFLICCIWSVGYWFVYPAWPTISGNTKGSAGWTQFKKLANEQAEIVTRRGEFVNSMKVKSLAEIQNDPELYAYATAGGKIMFKENCAACHGTGAEGGRGFPNLNDDDWLWGGKLEDIYTTIKHGIRSADEQARMSEMPAFGRDEFLNPEQIASVANYVISLSGGKGATAEGELIFNENCSSCHGSEGKGDREFGAPNLSDSIWLYDGSKEGVIQQVNNPRHGVMPNWNERLPDSTIKQLAIYIHSLGGGEK